MSLLIVSQICVCDLDFQVTFRFYYGFFFLCLQFLVGAGACLFVVVNVYVPVAYRKLMDVDSI